MQLHDIQNYNFLEIILVNIDGSKRNNINEFSRELEYILKETI